MASDDTAALVVSLSAQLTKFEKDMKGAVDIAQKRTQEIESTFTKLNGTITDKLKDGVSKLSGNLGTAGSLLTALGPAGIAAAVGIGAAVGVMVLLADATDRFAEKAKVLKEGSENIGLTVTQFKELGEKGKTVGLDFDQTTAFFTRFIANMEELRKGGGPLYDALLKIDTGLLRELSTTKDSATAIDLLVKAYARLTDQTARLNLARAAGGRAGASGGRLLQTLADQNVSVGGTEANKDFDDKIERANKLKVEIAALKEKADLVWGGMFSDGILGKQKAAAELMLRIAEAVDRIVNGTKTIGEAANDIPNFAERFSAATPRLFVGRNKETPDAPKTDTTTGSAAVELEILQKNIALLGEAVKQSEQLRLKKLEIAVAVEKGGIADGNAARALAAFNLAQQAAVLAVRERLAVATQQEIADVRLAQLQQDKIKYGLSENEVTKATVVILREAKQAAEALEVRAAYLPGLKQLELDSKNLSKGLDTVLTNSLNTITDDLTAMATGTKTVKDAFTDMVKSILNDIIKLTIKQLITGPAAGLLGDLFSVGKNAEGTDNWQGGPTWVGEKGPEIVNLPKGAQVIPNAIAARGGGSPTISITNHVDATGADPVAVNRLLVGLRQVNASIETRAVKAVQSLQFRSG